jgi:hypothetical protein
MSTKGLVIREDGTIEVRDFPERDKLDILYEVLGTDIVEVVTLGDGSPAYVDEEGKLKRRARNGIATKLYAQQDVIVGPMVVFGGIDDEGYETDVDDNFIARMEPKEYVFMRPFNKVVMALSDPTPVEIVSGDTYPLWVSGRGEAYFQGLYVGDISDFARFGESA